MFAPRLALLPLVLVALACTEPSGTGGTVDAPAPANEPTAEVEAGQKTDEAANDPNTVLATVNADAADSGAEPAIAGAEPPEPEPMIPEQPYKVLILGDSLARTAFGALLEDKLDAHPHVECYRKAKSATGLARPDFYDWFDQGSKEIELRKPDLVVVVMGGNDGQDIPPWKGSPRVQWDTEGWPAAYRQRVDQFLQLVSAPIAREDGSEISARVLWLGLPQMGLRSLEKKLVLIRQIQQDAVASLGGGAVYLDTTPFLVDGQGALLDTATVDGKSQELRADDGIHFTMSGSEYLADKVYPEVLGVLNLPEASEAKPTASEGAGQAAKAGAPAGAGKPESVPPG